MIKDRIQNALWALFIADSLAMPVHWYYNIDNIPGYYPGGIQDYEAPRHPHPESFMVGSDYKPDIETAKELGRPFDILHNHAGFYETNFARQEVRTSDREEMHGNLTPDKKERYHYHHGLKKGENTLGAHLVRVLMRSVAANNGYDPSAFLKGFIDHMTTPGTNRDPYTEIYIRRWFENYTRGLPLHACAEDQRNVWSIASHGGVIRPLVLSLLPGNSYQGSGLSVEHQILTHRSQTVTSALHILVPLVHGLTAGGDPETLLIEQARKIRVPLITGKELFSAYKEHNGPGNIPKKEMWEYHTRLNTEPFDLQQTAAMDEEEVIIRKFATACYPEHGLPLLLYLALRNDLDVQKALLANANAGGDNVHRGMILGMIVGACAKEIPSHLKKGLMDHERIAEEIDAFSGIVMTQGGY